MRGLSLYDYIPSKANAVALAMCLGDILTDHFPLVPGKGKGDWQWGQPADTHIRCSILLTIGSGK